MSQPISSETAIQPPNPVFALSTIRRLTYQGRFSDALAALKEYGQLYGAYALAEIERIRNSAQPQHITIHIEGGLVADVTGIPAGYELRVEDYDIQDTGDDDSWDAEKECAVTVYEGGAA